LIEIGDMIHDSVELTCIESLAFPGKPGSWSREEALKYLREKSGCDFEDDLLGWITWAKANVANFPENFPGTP
jgi:hypothetical protein